MTLDRTVDKRLMMYMGDVGNTSLSFRTWHSQSLAYSHHKRLIRTRTLSWADKDGGGRGAWLRC